jgi:hypothetical protein
VTSGKLSGNRLLLLCHWERGKKAGSKPAFSRQVVPSQTGYKAKHHDSTRLHKPHMT